MTEQLTEEEASGLAIDPALRRLLTPQEVSALCVLPIERGADGNSITMAADPAAPGNVDMVLRMRLGVRRVELRPATREAMQVLLAEHLLPYWTEKGWEFPGLPELPEPAPPKPAPQRSAPQNSAVKAPTPGAAEPSRPAAVEKVPPADARPQADHPVVLIVDSSEARRQALAGLLLEAGYEPRSATTQEAVERELRRAPPSVVVARADGPVPIDALVPLVRKAGGAIELRVHRDYAAALLGSAADERVPSFLFDLVRFFAGIVSAAAGAAVHRTEARAQAVERAALHMGLPPSQVEAARLAALFDGLDVHLRRLVGGGEAAGKEATGGSVLGQLLDPARTPFPIRAALEEREESFDGTGPCRLVGEQISPAARILAAVDSFFVLKDGGASGAELEAKLRNEAEKRLDPRAVEAVLRGERAGRLVDRLGSVEERVLVVDPDPVAASLLEMRLANSGFDVEVHRDGESAFAAAVEKRPDVVISEVAVPSLDGFSLLVRLRKGEATHEIPFIFVSERTDRGSTVKGFDLGADDFIPKPADLELLAAKVKGLVRKARARRPAKGEGGGISGSLADMSLVDLLQALTASRRTARLRVEDGHGAAGEMAIEKGRLVDARLGEEIGQEAFFMISAWTEGRFTVRADDPPAEKTINAPLEMLLLEICRRRDEASRLA